MTIENDRFYGDAEISALGRGGLAFLKNNSLNMFGLRKLFLSLPLQIKRSKR
jgi:hypothetical protein